MTGAREHQVTYPTFVLPKNEEPLIIIYRDGTWNAGEARMKIYSESCQQWEDNPDPILSGLNQAPWTSNAYWNTPVRGRDGTLHVSFTWRTHYVPGSLELNNIDICYAKSYDNGFTWYSSDERPFELPITQVNSETIAIVPPGSNLMNQCGMTLDSFDQPHVVFYADDSDGVPQYQHLWFDGQSWKRNVISAQGDDFDLSGSGTLSIPMTRPQIVLDQEDTAYVLYAGTATGGRMCAAALAAPDYDPLAQRTFLLTNEETGHSEPLIDSKRWDEYQVLSLYMQFSDQPLSDDVLVDEQCTAWVLDVHQAALRTAAAGPVRAEESREGRDADAIIEQEYERSDGDVLPGG